MVLVTGCWFQIFSLTLSHLQVGVERQSGVGVLLFGNRIMRLLHPERMYASICICLILFLIIIDLRASQ